MSSAAGVALSSLSRSNPPTRPSTPCQEPQHYRTPFERTSEQLNSQEKHTWGFTALQISLKPPPSARLALGPARRVPESSTAATSANLSRAKRPKAIKFSPAKASKRSARVQSNPGLSRLAAASDAHINNQDFCLACGGKGHLLVCDGCPRSFHFSCLDPPLELDQIPDDAWFCKACEATQTPHQKPKHGLFGPLLDRLDLDPPKTYFLPPFIINSFDGIAANSSGEYTRSSDKRVPRLNKAGFPEPPDPFKHKDSKGRPVYCYACFGAASITLQKRIVGCDYCEQHWHLDCLDPPLTTFPTSQRKWMCPLHSDHHAPAVRKLKPERTVKISQRNMSNNGNVSVIPRPQRRPREEPMWDEKLHRGIRYQVPEDTLILDFWAKVRDPDRRISNQRKLAKQLGEHEEGETSDSSDLTSLDSDSENEERRKGSHRSSALNRTMTSGNASQSAQALTPTSAAAPERPIHSYDSPLPLDQRTFSETSSVAGSEVDARQHPNNASAAGISPSTPIVSGEQTSKLQHSARNREGNQASASSIQSPAQVDDKSRASTPLSTDILSHKDAPSKSAVGTPLVTSHSNGSQLKVRLSLPPKERESPDPTEGPPAKRAKTVRGSPRPDGSRPIPEVMIERLDQDSETNSPDTEQNGPSDSHVGTALPNSNANDKPINMFDEEEDDLKPIAGFAVRTKDDLKALSRVRKLLKDEKGFADQQSHLMGFLFGDNPEVPQLRGHTERTPGWDNPWEEHGKSMGQTKLLNGRR